MDAWQLANTVDLLLPFRRGPETLSRPPVDILSTQGPTDPLFMYVGARSKIWQYS